MENFVRFLILLATAMIVRFLGRRYIPLLMPEGRLKTLGTGILGGLIGQWLGGQWGFAQIEVVGLYIFWVVAGTIMAVLILGLIPFFKVFFWGKI